MIESRLKRGNADEDFSISNHKTAMISVQYSNQQAFMVFHFLPQFHCKKKVTNVDFLRNQMFCQESGRRRLLCLEIYRHAHHKESKKRKRNREQKDKINKQINLKKRIN